MANQPAEKPQLCHSEQSEESLLRFFAFTDNRREILRFAQNDRINAISAACKA
jgi:hypothetical protein